MAGAPDAPAAYNRKSFYQDVLRGIVINWSNCSNQGMAESEGKVFCECAPEPRCFLLPCMYCHTTEKECDEKPPEAVRSNRKVQGETSEAESTIEQETSSPCMHIQKSSQNEKAVKR